jgi:hypothetical protein
MTLAGPQGLLAMVPNPLGGAQDQSRQSLEHNQTSQEVWEKENTHFGDIMELKQEYNWIPEDWRYIRKKEI